MNKLFLKHCLRVHKLLRFSLRFKYERHTQAGLTRYHWDAMDYKKYDFERSRMTHWSNGEELINRVPPVEVDDDVFPIKDDENMNEDFLYVVKKSLIIDEWKKRRLNSEK